MKTAIKLTITKYIDFEASLKITLQVNGDMTPKIIAIDNIALKPLYILSVMGISDGNSLIVSLPR